MSMNVDIDDELDATVRVQSRSNTDKQEETKAEHLHAFTVDVVNRVSFVLVTGLFMLVLANSYIELPIT